MVLLGPAHRMPVRGLALPQAEEFATPLGHVCVDQAACDIIRTLPQVISSDAAHALEHSLEVQLPFLQKVLGEFALVPLAVGDASRGEVAEVLDALWGGPETLIVVSSDLSHYHSYEQAERLDRETCETIRRLDADVDHEQACGGTPINGLMEVARRRRLVPHARPGPGSAGSQAGRSAMSGFIGSLPPNSAPFTGSRTIC